MEHTEEHEKTQTIETIKTFGTIGIDSLPSSCENPSATRHLGRMPLLFDKIFSALEGGTRDKPATPRLEGGCPVRTYLEQNGPS